MLPVDSEHSAIYQCLEGRSVEHVHSLVLTASGGPFRGRTRDELRDVTPDQALAHPTWHMGSKITIDSATLANKGLELIEAHFLFGIPYEQVEVVVQPTSIVHSLVRFRDGAVLAHLGYPDMRVPISYALTYPTRAATPLAPLDLASLTLEFHAPDLETFPMLALAREAGEKGGTYPCAYIAANEVAVAAFLEGRLAFLDIAEVVADALGRVDGSPVRDVDELVEADAAARALADERLAVACRGSSSASGCCCSSSCTSSATSASRSPSASGRARSTSASLPRSSSSGVRGSSTASGRSRSAVSSGSRACTGPRRGTSRRSPPPRCVSSRRSRRACSVCDARSRSPTTTPCARRSPS
jgi:hypothetical protein